MSQERKYFGTDGIRGEANQSPLTPEFALRLGRAVAQTLLGGSGSGPVSEWPVCLIGKDTRISGDMLEAALAAGLNSVGVDVRLAGVIPTPAVAAMVRESDAGLGIVISASHNPYQDNGIKFFDGKGEKLTDEIESAIESAIELAIDSAVDQESGEIPRALRGRIGRISAIENSVDQYVNFAKATVGDDPFLQGVTIAIDTANGAAVETSPRILEELGAHVHAFHNRPTGLNINASCGCTHGEVIGDLVRTTGANVGISHDGDADRVLLCDENGELLDGDEIMAIVASAMLSAGELKHNTLVTTVMSNQGLVEAIESRGGKVLRTDVGDRYVLRKMREGGYNFGGEQSGHFVFYDFNTTGDGIVSALQVLRIMVDSKRPLSELKKIFKKFPQLLRNIPVNAKPPVKELGAAWQLVQETEKTMGSEGRILLRYSGTESLIRLLMEGRDRGFIEKRADEIAELIEAEIGEGARRS